MAFFIKQESEPSIGELLGSLTGAGIKTGASYLAQRRQQQAQEQLTQTLKDLGAEDRLADIYGSATEGGKTAILNKILEDLEREPTAQTQSPLTRKFKEQLPKDVLSLIEEGKGPAAQEPEVDIEDLQVFEPDTSGMTKKEAVAHRKEHEKRAFETNKKYVESLSDNRKELPRKRIALGTMRGALERGDFSSLRNAAADYLGLDFLKNATAQTVNTANKEFLLSDLVNIKGGRPNVFLERIFSKALLNPQYQAVANEIILEGFEGLEKIKEFEIDYADRIAEKYLEKGKELPRNYQSIVHQKVKSEAEKLEKQLEKRVRQQLQGVENEGKIRPARPGEKLTQDLIDSLLERSGNNPQKAEELARKLGYEF